MVPRIQTVQTIERDSCTHYLFTFELLARSGRFGNDGEGREFPSY